jgi:hypothetical protein
MVTRFISPLYLPAFTSTFYRLGKARQFDRAEASDNAIWQAHLPFLKTSVTASPIGPCC